MIRDWTADCGTCGNIVRARMSNPWQLVSAADRHQDKFPGHVVSIKGTGDES